MAVETVVFTADSVAQVVKLAMRAITALGWKIDFANELGIVTFQTGMTWNSWNGVSGSLTIEEIGPNKFSVKGSGKQNASGDLGISFEFWNESEGKIQKVINKMQELYAN